MSPTELLNRCREILESEWQRIAGSATGKFDLDERLLADIDRTINGKTKTYRYVLPTQLLAKLARNELDARCIQSARGGPGAFDARTIAHSVVVPFDCAHHAVLGGSAEPYVNNPLRVEAIEPAHRAKQKDKEGWDALCRVLHEVETVNEPSFTLSLFHAVLTAIRNRMDTIKVTYPIPLRSSLDSVLAIVGEFTQPRTGGDRLQAVAAALFETIGRRFQLFENVRRSKTNAADASTGQIADLECMNAGGEIVFAVEVKDRELTVIQIQDKIPAIRELKAADVFFLATSGVKDEDVSAVEQVIMGAYASGHSIYVLEFKAFCRTVLSLCADGGRRDFLEAVGRQLDEFCETSHRSEWALLLGRL